MKNAVSGDSVVDLTGQRTGNSHPNPPFTYAFQPIVDVTARNIVSYEALIRGQSQESAFHVLQQVPKDQKYVFDQVSRANAVRIAGELGIDCMLNLNYLPQSLASCTDSISSTLAAAQSANVNVSNLVLEITESEMVTDSRAFGNELNEYRKLGIKTAIDDFGAGYSGLNLLADFQPDQVKIDMKLVRGIQSDGPRQSIVRAISMVCLDLGIDLIAEGVETVDEFRWLSGNGIELYQGYLFAKPGFESLPPALFPDPATAIHDQSVDS